MIVLGSGTVSDIAHSSERGKYAGKLLLTLIVRWSTSFVGIVLLGPILGPCIGYLS